MPTIITIFGCPVSLLYDTDHKRSIVSTMIFLLCGIVQLELRREREKEASLKAAAEKEVAALKERLAEMEAHANARWVGSCGSCFGSCLGWVCCCRRLISVSRGLA